MVTKFPIKINQIPTDHFSKMPIKVPQLEKYLTEKYSAGSLVKVDEIEEREPAPIDYKPTTKVWYSSYSLGEDFTLIIQNILTADKPAELVTRLFHKMMIRDPETGEIGTIHRFNLNTTIKLKLLRMLYNFR